MTTRTFSSATLGDRQVAFDPATGLTHLAPRGLSHGHVRLDDTEVCSWPTVAQRQLPTQIPLSLCWSPIVRCNLSCPHCLDDKTLAESGTTERRRIAGILAASGTLGVDISGGEPLLLRDLPQLLMVLAGQGTAVSCTTNGWHLQRRAAELAALLAAVRVSLDGGDAASHDHWRGQGSFARACAGIRAAVAEGVPVQVQAVVMRSTLHHAQSVVDLAADLGAQGVTFLQMLPIGAGAHMATKETVSDADAVRVIGSLQMRDHVRVRLRTRELAEGFTVVRADGLVYRNGAAAGHIIPSVRLLSPADLQLPVPSAEGGRT